MTYDFRAAAFRALHHGRRLWQSCWATGRCDRLRRDERALHRADCSRVGV